LLLFFKKEVLPSSLPGFGSTEININHDFGSILRFTETNFGLPHIGSGYYADAFASNLVEFLRRQSPRPFVAIPAKWNAAFFLHQPPSSVPGDND
jgi:hypothetical protein